MILNFTILLLEGVSTGELLLVILAIFLLFGPKKVPEIAKGLAKGIKKIKETQDSFQNEVNTTIDPIKKELNNTTEQLKNELNIDKNKPTENNTGKNSRPDFIG
ncbi:MAG TPA: twin-arginine translocase TatA/TatE family subunit [Bacteroidales bacterium]|nr:twin-arginine translocase TatA/TatE family subunit [Bacteroidales bacterium]